MRLDKALVARGLVDSRSRAQALVRDGHVTVAGQTVVKPSLDVSDDSQISVDAPHQWVSRAALKLVHGLDAFGIDPNGKTALDVGASTGGFTQVLLARGTAQVIALDVGHDQLHASLRDDARVVVMEGVNARALEAGELPDLDLVVSDVSFISLEKALPRALDAARLGAQLVALIKPQFEVGRAHVGKGGIVKDAAARTACCDAVTAFLTSQGWDVMGVVESPITGSDGNIEFLVAATKSG